MQRDQRCAGRKTLHSHQCNSSRVCALAEPDGCAAEPRKAAGTASCSHYLCNCDKTHSRCLYGQYRLRREYRVGRTRHNAYNAALLTSILQVACSIAVPGILHTIKHWRKFQRRTSDWEPDRRCLQIPLFPSAARQPLKSLQKPRQSSHHDQQSLSGKIPRTFRKSQAV